MTSPTSAAVLQAFSTLPSAAADQAAKAEAGDAAKKFEQLLLFELLKAMRRTVPVAEDDGSALTRQSFETMFDQAIAQTAAGRLGVAPMLERQLSRGAPTRAPGPIAPSAPFVPTRVAPPADGRSRSGVVSGLPQPGDLPVDGRRSSEYGWRTHPISGERKFHGGLDLAAPEGHEIRAVQGGIVTFAGWRGGYGNTVEIRHDDGATTRYAHASRLHVRVGERVDAGEGIADVGTTGQSTGPHLHFEVRRDGKTTDPDRYLAQLKGSQ